MQSGGMQVVAPAQRIKGILLVSSAQTLYSPHTCVRKLGSESYQRKRAGNLFRRWQCLIE